MVTRARDGDLRPFVNVCRHAGTTVAEGQGKRETLEPPYRAWTHAPDATPPGLS
jgi:phenylpropionate dioxygenase-like ring-hydroxylating dioxygenase large terminal subunit